MPSRAPAYKSMLPQAQHQSQPEGIPTKMPETLCLPPPLRPSIEANGADTISNDRPDMRWYNRMHPPRLIKCSSVKCCSEDG